MTSLTCNYTNVHVLHMYMRSLDILSNLIVFSGNFSQCIPVILLWIVSVILLYTVYSSKLTVVFSNLTCTFYRSLDTLSNLVSHTMDEAFFSLTLTHELCVLPLAYQITCIAGNALGRTLQGGRSERNEFLLLHAFTQKGYIPPDRLEGSRKSGVPSEDGEGVVSKRNKPTYAGGLVLEPKVGFYNRWGVCSVYSNNYKSTHLPCFCIRLIISSTHLPHPFY